MYQMNGEISNWTGSTKYSAEMFLNIVKSFRIYKNTVIY